MLNAFPTLSLFSFCDLHLSAFCKDVDPLEAIELELDKEDDASVYDWFYDTKPLQHTRFLNGPSYKKWKLPLPIMSTLYR